MTEWWAKLVGDEREISLLEDHLAGTDHRIIKDGTYFYCRVADLPEDFKSAELLGIVSQLISQLNGAAKLRFGKFTGVSSNKVLIFKQDGTKYGYASLTLKPRSFTFTPIPLPDKKLDRWLSVCESDDFVNRALTIYGAREHDYRNLFMVLEIIEEDMGGEKAVKQANWVSGNRLKRFKQTTNAYCAIGNEARHAKIKIDPPAKIMAIEEAREMIQTLLSKWIESKHT